MDPEELHSISNTDELENMKHVLFIKSEIRENDYESLNNKTGDDIRVKEEDLNVADNLMYDSAEYYDINIKDELENNLLRASDTESSTSTHNCTESLINNSHFSNKQYITFTDEMKSTDDNNDNNRNLSNNTPSLYPSQLNISCADNDTSVSQQEKDLTHTDGKSYECDTNDSVLNEQKSHVGDKWLHVDENPYMCAVCNGEFTPNETPATGEQVHTGTKYHVCNECKGIEDNSTLETSEDTHTDRKPYVCVVCNKMFLNKWKLVLHQYSHTDEKFVCDVCNKSFNQPYNLVRHKRTHGRTPIVRRRVHRGEKPYVCKVCSKAFFTPSGLWRHKNIHTKQTSV